MAQPPTAARLPRSQQSPSEGFREPLTSREVMQLNSDSGPPLYDSLCVASGSPARVCTAVDGRGEWDRDASFCCCSVSGDRIPIAPDGVGNGVITTHPTRSGNGEACACANQDANMDAGADMGKWCEQHSQQEGNSQLMGPEDLTFDPGRTGEQDEGSASRDSGRWEGSHGDRHQDGPEPWDSDWDWQQYLRWSQRPHRDSAVVEVDVARSMWGFTRDLSDQQRESRREQLKRLLNAVVAAHGGDVFYYQGLHDVASVLLMCMPGGSASQLQMLLPLAPLSLDAADPASPTSAAATQLTPHPLLRAAGLCAVASTPTTVPSAVTFEGASVVSAAAYGELLAFALLRRLVTTHLRDATRPSLEPVVQLLGLMPYLVHAADPALARHMADRDLQPFFALSWFLTWWAHELDELPAAARLFDFFLASHPLMPLYLGAVAMRSQRTSLLACEDMPELHSILMNLKLVAANSDGDYEGAGRRRSKGNGAGRTSIPLKDLLRQAEQLWLAKPPHELIPLRAVHGSLPSQQQLRQRRASGNSAAAAAAGRISGRRDGDMGDGEMTVVLTACVAHAARMEGKPALWKVPNLVPAEWPDRVGGDVAQVGQSGLGRILSRANNILGTRRSRRTLLSTALLAGVYVAAAVAIGYATLSRTTAGHH
ncbi:hypothetical protein Vafri_7563 [Volvox africanus]|nr:hypothetical protein Vafri_7563 [Volvox africanus]